MQQIYNVFRKINSRYIKIKYKTTQTKSLLKQNKNKEKSRKIERTKYDKENIKYTIFPNSNKIAFHSLTS